MAVAVACAGVQAAAAQAYPDPGYTTTPGGGGQATGGPISVADPSMATVQQVAPATQLLRRRALASEWAMYGTGNVAYLSTDRVTFANAGAAEVPQSWWSSYSATGTPWAPNVQAGGTAGTEWMFYSVTKWGTQRSAIGLATSSTGLPGSWMDRGGPILTSGSGSAYNAIDPSMAYDRANGTMWLAFGSFWHGIYVVQLNPSTGASLGTPVHVAEDTADTDIEGADLVFNDGYWYLFFSHGSCCAGFSSSYRVMVGRSLWPTGPYYDQSGHRLLTGAGESAGTEILASHGYVAGPGGEDIESDPSDGATYMSYAYWDRRYRPSTGRVFGINHLDFNAAGWPYLW